MRIGIIILASAAAIGAAMAVAAKTPEQRTSACAASVAELRDIDPGQVSVEESIAGADGSHEIFFRTPDNRGSCIFDSTDRLIDVRMATGTQPWNGRGGGDVSAQEQACAGELSRRTNVPISRVTVTQSRPAPLGGRRMTVSVEGARAVCATTHYNAISEFRLVDYNQ